jgi:hypothetical protein
MAIKPPQCNPFVVPKTSVFEQTIFMPSWRHPIRTVREFFRSLRYAWQRATRGWSDVDCWDIDSWLCHTMPGMLAYLAEHHCAYPGTMTADTPVKWSDILNEMARAAWACDESNNAYTNPYYEPWMAMLSEHRVQSPRKEMSEDEAQLHRNYLDTEHVIAALREGDKDHFCDLLKTHFFSLWD